MRLVPEPLRVRREALEMLVEHLQHPKVQLNRVLGVPDQEEAEALMEQGVEGVMLKRRDSLYEEGKRSWSWLKVKATDTYDVVIVDMEAEPTAEDRKAAGWKNLRYGLVMDGKLVVVGSLGVTGPPEELQTYIGHVAEIKGWGQSPSTGAIRHPGFIRLRDDKLPEECTFEREAA